MFSSGETDNGGQTQRLLLIIQVQHPALLLEIPVLIKDKGYLSEAQNEREDDRQRETETREGQLQSQHNTFMPERPLSTCHNNSLSPQERPNVGELDEVLASLRHLHHQSDDGERAVNSKRSAVPSWRMEDVCYAVLSIYALVS